MTTLLNVYFSIIYLTQALDVLINSVSWWPWFPRLTNECDDTCNLTLSKSWFKILILRSERTSTFGRRVSTATYSVSVAHARNTMISDMPFIKSIYQDVQLIIEYLDPFNMKTM
ncbi:hypothetical protein RF11_12701 [Thelohanellus kitauei]|uniref:Uncharacterized protein n=1 Tax=Thelohanellus kitauei TaxID=669202 RepID=A0A0C2JBY8_THEKT|nr:hypothetical protein RF11_12701 [Thelohanellus kitauei]